MPLNYLRNFKQDHWALPATKHGSDSHVLALTSFCPEKDRTHLRFYLLNSKVLHASDVGISVDSAVDAAKDAADIVLQEKDLGVLAQGVREGRMTFANTLKYDFMATSANFGNMFSMAGVSLFLPFIPLLPGQILLTNLMTDIPEMTIATDGVDGEMVDHPRRWNIGFIRNFMLVFGILSSVFDYLTFGALFFILHATPDQFRTGWLLFQLR